MKMVLGLVVLVLDIVALVDLFKSARVIGKKVFWALVILILPVLGLLLYYFIGKKKI